MWMPLVRYLAAFILVAALASRGLCKIYRSSCRREALFKSTGKDKTLAVDKSNIISSHFVTAVPLCGKLCTGEENCHSINYKKKPSSSKELNCQLLNINASDASASLQPANGWVHYEPVSQATGPRCRSAPCSPGFRCTETCDNPAGYKCIDINECESYPCNNGRCTNLVNGYRCNCTPGYGGTNCQTDINECRSNPCLNDGTCSDHLNRYTCKCKPGYTGTNCQTDINECQSNPCPKVHECSHGVDTYRCYCRTGFTGKECEINIDECASNPCLNGGTCRDGIAYYSCSCASGYSGPRCFYTFTEYSVSGSSGSITSPGYPNRYPGKSVNKWWITSSYSKVNITFTNVQLPYSHYIYVRDPYTTIATLHGSSNNTVYTSPGKAMSVELKATTNFNGIGFTAKWISVP